MKFHAKCATCGWLGRSFRLSQDAERDGDDHEIAVGTNQQHHYTRVVEGAADEDR